MSLLQTQRTAQTVLCASFPFNFANGDTMTNVNGKTVPFNTATAADSVFEIVKLPIGAVVLGVGLDMTTATNTACTASVGTQANPTVFLNGTSMATASRTESAASGSANATAGVQASGANIVLTLNNSGAASVGAGIVDVRYYVVNRASEVIGA